MRHGIGNGCDVFRGLSSMATVQYSSTVKKIKGDRTAFKAHQGTQSVSEKPNEVVDRIKMTWTRSMILFSDMSDKKSKHLDSSKQICTTLYSVSLKQVSTPLSVIVFVVDVVGGDTWLRQVKLQIPHRSVQIHSRPEHPSRSDPQQRTNVSIPSIDIFATLVVQTPPLTSP